MTISAAGRRRVDEGPRNKHNLFVFNRVETVSEQELQSRSKFRNFKKEVPEQESKTRAGFRFSEQEEQGFPQNRRSSGTAARQTGFRYG